MSNCVNYSVRQGLYLWPCLINSVGVELLLLFGQRKQISKQKMKAEGKKRRETAGQGFSCQLLVWIILQNMSSKMNAEEINC